MIEGTIKLAAGLVLAALYLVACFAAGRILSKAANKIWPICADTTKRVAGTILPLAAHRTVGAKKS